MQPNLRTYRGGLTAIELLAATSLATLMMAALLGVLGGITKHQKEIRQAHPTEAWQLALEEQIRWDLANSEWFKAGPQERPVVGVLILMFALVGVFTGPVNAVAAAGISREWLFAEDFGQAVVLAVMAGYVTGLAAATRLQN